MNREIRSWLGEFQEFMILSERTGDFNFYPETMQRRELTKCFLRFLPFVGLSHQYAYAHTACKSEACSDESGDGKQKIGNGVC